MEVLRKKAIKLLLLSTIIVLVLTAFTLYSSSASTPTLSVLSVTVGANKKSYYIREPVIIGGEVLQDGQPLTDCLISIEARNPRDDSLLYRTIPIGNPSQIWATEIKNVFLKDFYGNLTDTTTINSLVQLYATVQNTLLNTIDIVITATVLDGNSIPIFAGWHKTSMSAGMTQTFSWSIYIPEWAYSGKAQAFINVYNDFPKNGGTPHTLETQHVFYITRNPELKYPYSKLPETYSSQPGEYETSFKVSPDRYTLPGSYSIYATVTSSPVFKAYNSTSYNLDSYSCPPQAAFTYSPLEILANMTVTFDGSSSSAEGYNDTIICYEWNINDPYDPQHIVNMGNFTNPPDPTAEHAFAYPGTFTVELNVTDNEGLWSTTSKPITILPEYGPTANFIWTPPSPNVNETVTFDASSSEPGWSAQIADYAQITAYKWNFSDGIVVTVNTSMIAHMFIDPGNFTAKLTITDSVGRTDSISKIVEVQNQTRKIYDIAEPYGKIDMRDVAKVARAFGSKPGDDNWDPEADITGPTSGVPDGKVDMRDVSLVARHFGEEY